jgi:hypothetical protein
MGPQCQRTHKVKFWNEAAEWDDYAKAVGNPLAPLGTLIYLYSLVSLRGRND